MSKQNKQKPSQLSLLRCSTTTPQINLIQSSVWRLPTVHISLLQSFCSSIVSQWSEDSGQEPEPILLMHYPPNSLLYVCVCIKQWQWEWMYFNLFQHSPVLSDRSKMPINTFFKWVTHSRLSESLRRRKKNKTKKNTVGNKNVLMNKWEEKSN